MPGKIKMKSQIINIQHVFSQDIHYYFKIYGKEHSEEMPDQSKTKNKLDRLQPLNLNV